MKKIEVPSPFVSSFLLRAYRLRQEGVFALIGCIAILSLSYLLSTDCGPSWSGEPAFPAHECMPGRERRSALCCHGNEKIEGQPKHAFLHISGSMFLGHFEITTIC